MSMALELAKKGGGTVNPNPQVGAVVVKQGRVIGKGYHERYGHEHAEVKALQSCTESPENATMYVTLEPCAHQGKQPPCYQAIIKAGIKRVVFGSYDPNPLVSEKGIEAMRNEGLRVEGPILEKECQEINQIFFHYMTQHTPFVMLKYAMTLDGKIATATGASKWITGEVARKKVHQDRSRFMSIMVGVGTILADDPILTNHNVHNRNPIRVICDTHLRTPFTSKVVVTAQEIPTIIATGVSDKKKLIPYIKKGCQIINLPFNDNGIALVDLMKKLGHLRIDSLILEGGSTLNASAIDEGIINKLQVYIAPKIFGGKQALSPVGGKGVLLPEEALHLGKMKVSSLGEDLLIESEVI